MATPRNCEQEAQALARTDMLQRMRQETAAVLLEDAARVQFRMSPGAFAQLIDAILEGPDIRGDLPSNFNRDTITESRFRGIRVIKAPELISNFCLERLPQEPAQPQPPAVQV